MALRPNLHNELRGIMGSDNVYYQPPTSVLMKYPCIVYSLSGLNTQYADGMIYIPTRQYEVILIDPNPDSEFFDLILNHFQMCSFSGGYTANNLNHFRFTIHY